MKSLRFFALEIAVGCGVEWQVGRGGAEVWKNFSPFDNFAFKLKVVKLSSYYQLSAMREILNGCFRG